jgi:hypothetical protein
MKPLPEHQGSSSRFSLPTDFLVTQSQKKHLSADQEQVFLLRFGQGLNYGEIASILSTTVPACQKRMGPVYQKFGILGKSRGKETELRNYLISESIISDGEEISESSQTRIVKVPQVHTSLQIVSGNVISNAEEFDLSLTGESNSITTIKSYLTPIQWLDDLRNDLVLEKERKLDYGELHGGDKILRELLEHLPKVIERISSKSSKADIDYVINIIDATKYVLCNLILSHDQVLGIKRASQIVWGLIVASTPLDLVDNWYEIVVRQLNNGCRYIYLISEEDFGSDLLERLKKDQHESGTVMKHVNLDYEDKDCQVTFIPGLMKKFTYTEQFFWIERDEIKLFIHKGESVRIITTKEQGKVIRKLASNPFGIQVKDKRDILLTLQDFLRFLKQIQDTHLEIVRDFSSLYEYATRTIE